MRKILFVVLAIVAIAAIWLNNYLGGGEDLNFKTVEKELIVWGKEFDGSSASAELEKLFYQSKDKVAQNETTHLTIVNFRAAEDSVHQVVGVSGGESHPSGWQQYAYKGTFLQTVITAHNLVMPRPEEVLEMAQDHARENDLKLTHEYSIEIYEGERKLKVLFPLY